MKTLIRNAQVVLPDETLKTNVLIDGEIIGAVDAAIHSEADEVIEADGLYLMPGVIDDQVHFREPGLTHKEDLTHASRACAAGGVTSYLEMPNTIPNAINQARLNEKLELAGQRSIVNYGFYIGATTSNVEDLKQAKRTPGIKIFIGSSTGDLLVDDQEALERIFAETTLPICAHCEDETTIRRNAAKYGNETDVRFHSLIRDHAAALIATKRAVELAIRHQHPFHVLHVSTAAEIEVIREAGEIVTGEVCPHHLFFNVNDYPRLGSLIQMNPSIKSTEDNQALWNALMNGDIDVVATDHAPHTMEEKQRPFPQCPSGLPAVENSLALMLNQVNAGRCSIEQVVNWMSFQPARIWNIANKASIVPGFDADLVLVDMQLSRTIENQKQLTKCGWSPWHGETLTGWPVKTWVMGRQVFDYQRGAQEIWLTSEACGREIRYESRD